MNPLPPANADTRSPWTDCFRVIPETASATNDAAEGRAAARPDGAAAAPHPITSPNGFDREAAWWASEALFDSYNALG